MARHTWPVRVAAIPLHATTIRETHCIAATHTPLHAPNRTALGPASVLAFWRFGIRSVPRMALQSHCSGSAANANAGPTD